MGSRRAHAVQTAGLTARQASIVACARSRHSTTVTTSSVSVVKPLSWFLADDPAPPGAFVRGAYRRLRVGPYRVLYEVEGNLITIVRKDRV